MVVFDKMSIFIMQFPNDEQPAAEALGTVGSGRSRLVSYSKPVALLTIRDLIKECNTAVYT